MNEIDKYKIIYADPNRREKYGATNHGRGAVGMVRRMEPESIVDVGCGWNRFLKAFDDLETCGVDFACPGADVQADVLDLPFLTGQFDLLTSFDMLEHLRPEQVRPALLEMRRVSRRFCFSISYKDAVNKVEGESLHPTVRPESWWMRELLRAGAGRLKTRSGYISGVWSPKLDIAPDASVVLVGNGPVLMEHELGREIDAHDIVIRFNNYVLEGFEKHTGTKTSFWCTFQLNPEGKMSHDRLLNIHELTHAWEGIKEQYSVPMHYINHLQRQLRDRASALSGFERDVTGLRVTSGLGLACWLLEIVGVKRLSLAGFDHFAKQATRKHHYWLEKHYRKPREHDGQVEAMIFNELRAAGRVQYLTAQRRIEPYKKPSAPAPAPPRRPSGPRPIFKPCYFEHDIKMHAERKLLIAMLGRSGSHCVADWICSQLDADVRIAVGMNLREPFRNDPVCFNEKARPDRLPSWKPNPGAPVVCCTNLDWHHPSQPLDIPWIEAPRLSQVIVLRDPYNWLASVHEHPGRYRAQGPVRLTAAWKAYARWFLSPGPCVPVFYNAFIESKEYRDHLAQRIGMDRRSDESLSRVSTAGRGSSFDGLEYDGRAQEMKTTERWQAYADTDWMQALRADQEVAGLLEKVIESLPVRA